MKCLHPITITNRQKFFSLAFADQFKQTLPCGKCAMCQEKEQKEWYYRAYQEYLSTVENNGYMLMDCLTYSEKYVPRVSRYIRVPKYLNFRCFDYTDIRYFFVRLRSYLTKRGYNVEKTLRYFAAAEYGTEEKATHRPHIHILFYVTTPELDNITLSKAVSACWHYGRTDGIPYKSRRYVNEYTIHAGLASSQRVCKYVTKYVQKSSEFQKVATKRLAAIMHYLYDNRFTRQSQGKYHWELDYYYKEVDEKIDYNSYDSFARSETAKKLYRDLKRHLDQFHLQSLGFGASVLRDLDINEVMENNILTIPDGNKVVMRIGLPTYYKRKIFYEQIKIDGRKYWQLTNLGLKYREKRKQDLKKRLVSQYRLLQNNYGYSVDAEQLADYVINHRGRIVAPFDGDYSIIERLNSPLPFYNYSTPSDKKHFHETFQTFQYLGYVDNYDDVPHDYLNIPLQRCNAMEKILDDIDRLTLKNRQSQQKLFENRQHLNQVFKNLRL